MSAARSAALAAALALSSAAHAAPARRPLPRPGILDRLVAPTPAIGAVVDVDRSSPTPLVLEDLTPFRLRLSIPF